MTDSTIVSHEHLLPTLDTTVSGIEPAADSALLGAEQCDDHAKSHSQDGKHLSSAKQPCLPAARATDGTPQDTSDNMAAHTGDNGHSVTIASDSATTQGAESDSNTYHLYTSPILPPKEYSQPARDLRKG
jgi:hypothetical protein